MDQPTRPLGRGRGNRPPLTGVQARVPGTAPINYPAPGMSSGVPGPSGETIRESSGGRGNYTRGRGRPSESAPRRGSEIIGERPPVPYVGPQVPQLPGYSQFTPRPGAPPSNPLAQGRASSHGIAPMADSGAGGDGNGGRGGFRGRRPLSEIIITRPSNLVTKQGQSGKSVSLQTNYFCVTKTPQWNVYQYRVDFVPDIDLARVRRGILSEHKAHFKGYIFDGTVLFTTQALPDKTTEFVSKNREGEPVKIIVKHVGVVQITDNQYLQILNLILRRAMEGLKLQLVGRNFFDAIGKIKVDFREYRMEIWPGYLTSIRQQERDIMLCVDIAHKIMRTDTLYHILKRCSSESRNFQDAFKKEVVGSIVLTDYNNKTYRIDEVDFDKNPQSTFSTKDGECSYLDYYMKRYNIKINDKLQPLLVSRSTEKNRRAGENDLIMLIPELARATGLTDQMRENFFLTRELGNHTRLSPSARIQRLMAYNQRLQKTKASIDVLKDWNLTLDPNLVEVNGRILKNEKIIFGRNMVAFSDNNADWTREFRNKSMFVHIDLKRWIVVMPTKTTREANDFIKLLVQAAGGMHMTISQPQIQTIQDDRNGTYTQALEQAAIKDPQLIMAVVPNINAERYSCIKKKCCVDRAIPSQVIVHKTITPKQGKPSSSLLSVATKVVIQMNAKLQGAPWMIDLPLSGLMTVGFDVCHSARDASKSYGALIATMDLKLSSAFFSAVSQHMKGQELSNDISLNMVKALQQFREIHGKLPSRILFFRDGVGDGQLHQVFENEVQHLTKQLDEIYRNAGHPEGCSLAYIIVTKRINTRYFLGQDNPPPGTVVDDVITLPERYDFYLVSQSVRQGTVSPTSYNVIYDTMKLDADKIQMLAYKFCHLYYNWSGTTRVPAVCQYAHKLAFLISQSIHQVCSNRLEKQLYFL